eukprot:3681443-Pyramimonas_sp.AAC.1
MSRAGASSVSAWRGNLRRACLPSGACFPCWYSRRVIGQLYQAMHFSAPRGQAAWMSRAWASSVIELRLWGRQIMLAVRAGHRTID